MEDSTIPKTPSWDEEGLTVEEFLMRVDERRGRHYIYEIVKFTHDVFFHEQLVGEAGCVEEVGHGLYIGLLSYGGMDPSYDVIDSRLTLLPKRLTRD